MNMALAKTTTISRRVFFDILLLCRDGNVKASSQILAANSEFFKINLFSDSDSIKVHQIVSWDEIGTGTVRLDDASVSDMVLLLQLCEPRHCYDFLLEDLCSLTIQSVLLVANRLSFKFAFQLISKQFGNCYPTPEAIQIADRLDLSDVLSHWSLRAESPIFFHDFVLGLTQCKLSAGTVELFFSGLLGRVLAARLRQKCMVLRDKLDIGFCNFFVNFLY